MPEEGELPPLPPPPTGDDEGATPPTARDWAEWLSELDAALEEAIKQLVPPAVATSAK